MNISAVVYFVYISCCSFELDCIALRKALSEIYAEISAVYISQELLVPPRVVFPRNCFKKLKSSKVASSLIWYHTFRHLSVFLEITKTSNHYIVYFFCSFSGLSYSQLVKINMWVLTILLVLFKYYFELLLLSKSWLICQSICSRKTFVWPA